MKLSTKQVKALFPCLLLLAPLLLGTQLEARNKVLGTIKLEAANKAAKDSGIWVDGQYVGYLKELKGSKKIMLLPGKHHIEVRESGYQTITREVRLEPGQKEIVPVLMVKDPNAHYGAQTAVVKISGKPERAAVFVDKQFVGHVDQFNGPGQGMLLTPGKHEIKVTLPGYKAFETEVTLVPQQKLKLKTNLMPTENLKESASR